MRLPSRLSYAVAIAAVSLGVAVAGCGSSSTTGGTGSTAAGGTTSSTANGGSNTTAGGSTTGSASAGSYKKGLKLAFFSVGDNNTYLQAGIKGAQAAAAKYGASLHVFNANFDGALQLNQVMSTISQGGYNGFILEPNNSQQLCTAVQAAIKAKIVIGITNVPACTASYDKPYPGTAVFVGGQSPESYTQWYEQGFKSAPTGSFGVLTGPITQGNTVRAQQVLAQVLPKYPGWKDVGGVQPADYQASEALTITTDMLQANPNLSAIFSNYAGQTPGAISAIKAAGKLGKVKIYDLGGDQAMFAAVAAGQVASTQVYLPYEEEERAVQAVVAQLSGLKELGGVKVGQYWDLTKDPRLHGLSSFVTKGTIAKYKAIGLPEY